MTYRYDIGPSLRRICIMLGAVIGLNFFVWNARESVSMCILVTVLGILAVVPGIIATYKGSTIMVQITEESFTLKLKDEGYTINWEDVSHVSIDEQNYVYIKHKEGLAPIPGFMENIDQMVEQIKQICQERNIPIRKAVSLT